MPGTPPSAPRVALRPLVDSSWAVPAVVGCVFFLVLIGAWLGPRRSRGEELRQRILSHGAPPEPSKNGRERRATVPRPKALFAATEGALGSFGPWRRASLLVTRSGVQLRVVEVFYLSIALGVGLGIVASAAGIPLVFVAIIVIAGLALPLSLVQMKGVQRLRAFDAQLPDHLSTLAASLKVGHSLRHAFSTLAVETSEPSRSEFTRVVSQARIGVPLETALKEMGERVGSDDLDYIVTAIAVQAQVGGSLASLIDMVSETVRHRQQHARKVRSLTAMGRLSAYMLIALPFLLAALIALVNRPYLAPLFHRSVGHDLIVYSIVSMTIGALLLKKIIAIKE
jgi:tight adherence protein B